MVRGKAADGHEFGIYRAEPAGKPRGCIVVAQEIFGVNSHIRAVCDDYATQGYLVVAPALFDRVEIDFPNRRVVFDLPSGASRETRQRFAANMTIRGS